MGRGLPGEKGFSLVEVMVVAAIMGIGYALALPMYQQWIARSELRDFTSQLASNLTLSRMVARNRNTPMTATFNKAADGKLSVGFTVTVSPVIVPNSLAGGSMTVITSLGPPPVPSVTDFVSAAPGLLGTIMFNPQGVRVGGGVGNQTVSFLSTQGVTNSVVVTPAGKVNWCATATCP